MIPPETISPTHISSLHQATDCHCSTVKVCKDGNEWMALLRSPSWWKQWNQQNISRFVKKKSTQNVEWWSNKVRHVLFHLHFAELNTRHSKTSHSLYIAGTISGIGRYATFALRLQPHYSWRFAKNTTLDNEGSSKINQQSITGIISEHMVVYNQQQKKQVGVPVYIVYIYIYSIHVQYICWIFQKINMFSAWFPHPGLQPTLGNLESHMYKTLSIKDRELVEGIWDNEHLQVPNKTKGFNEPNIKWSAGYCWWTKRNPVTNNHLTCFTNPVL